MHGSFRQSGHPRSLAAGLLHFDVSFACWVLLGALGVLVAADLDLTPSQKALVVAVPLLAGSAFRIVLGLLSDLVGPRRVGIASLAVTALPLLYGWLWLDSLNEALAVGVLLGVAGASFAVALPLASRWYPREHQGLAMGIVGAGNSGTIVAALLAPRLAGVVGWQTVFGLALVPVGLALVGFVLLAKEPPAPATRTGVREYGRVLRQADAWVFCGFYSVTFGGFVGLTSFLPIFWHDQYGLTSVQAGTATAACAAAASLLRPVGGLIADRFGGTAVLSRVYVFVGALLLVMATMPPFPAAMGVLVVTMATLGVGNGAVFQLVPLRFGRDIGAVTGLVGAAGGVGGFLLAYPLGIFKETTGTYATGLAVFALASLVSFGALLAMRRIWSARSGSHALARAVR
jgi:NNP family nitrate/nitrite transporter-like MFS transporter